MRACECGKLLFEVETDEGGYHLEKYKAPAYYALRDTSLYVKQNKAAAIMSEAHKHLSWRELRELERYIFERLEK